MDGQTKMTDKHAPVPTNVPTYCKGRGFESHPSNIAVILFSQNSGKYWVNSATHIGVNGRNQNEYSLSLLQI